MITSSDCVLKDATGENLIEQKDYREGIKNDSNEKIKEDIKQCY